MFFVWLITLIIGFCWITRMIINGRIIFRRTPLDIPILIFLVFQSFSFLVSIDHHNSLWGYYSRFNGGLLSLISYCFLYWAFVSNMDAKKTLFTIHLSLITALLAALYAIPAHFGYDPTCFILGRGLNANCWSAQFVPTERIFGTLGQPNWLAAWLVAIAPLSWTIIANLKFEIRNLKLIGKWKLANGKFILYILYSILLLLAIYFTRSQSGFIGLGVAFLVFAFGYFAFTHKWHFKKSAMVAIGGLLLIVLTIVIPRIPPLDRCLSIMFSQSYPITQEPSNPITPSSDIRCIVWKGAIAIWKHYPIFGSGQETFAFTYYNFKPSEHNLTSEWDHLYNKAHNEFLNYLANTGVLGLITYLTLISASLIYLFKLLNKYYLLSNKLEKTIKNNQYYLILSLLAGYASILVTNFFGFSTVSLQLLFFLFPAIAFALTHNTFTPSAIEGQPTTQPIYPECGRGATHNQPIKWLGSGLILLSTLYILHSTFQFYLADINYSSAEKANSSGQYPEALTYIRTAIEKNPNEPVYQDELTDIASSLAFLTYSQDIALSVQLASTAQNASDKALNISPRSVNFLRGRSNSFIVLGNIDPSYLGKAKEALGRAQELAPTDARIAYNLGFLYFQLGESTKAREQFKKALFLRPNYEDAQQALEEMNSEIPNIPN